MKCKKCGVELTGNTTALSCPVCALPGEEKYDANTVISMMIDFGYYVTTGKGKMLAVLRKGMHELLDHYIMSDEYKKKYEGFKPSPTPQTSRVYTEVERDEFAIGFYTHCSKLSFEKLLEIHGKSTEEIMKILLSEYKSKP